MSSYQHSRTLCRRSEVYMDSMAAASSQYRIIIMNDSLSVASHRPIQIIPNKRKARAVQCFRVDVLFCILYSYRTRFICIWPVKLICYKEGV